MTVAAVPEIRVKVADLGVARGDSLLTTLGLGSCVAIALHDPVALVGGLAHVLLPSPTMSRDASNGAKFPHTAVAQLLERMIAAGARQTRLRAKIAGGASMFSALLPVGGLQIGERNVIATRQALERLRIPIVAQDVGGGHGRSVFFRVASGEVEVRSLAKGHLTL
jgi:chemotaxis protein CheD